MLLGVCGFQSAGKDTIAEYLVQTHGFVRFSFAAALKDIISTMFGWSRLKLEGLTQEDRAWREQVDPWWAARLNMPQLTPRYVMQYFATDLFRNHFHPDIWLKIVEHKVMSLLEANSAAKIVISDCRFENEISMILRLGGKIIQVHRNPPDWYYAYRRGETPTEIQSMHRSELEWIRCYHDYDVDNHSTLPELFAQINHILQEYQL